MCCLLSYVLATYNNIMSMDKINIHTICMATLICTFYKDAQEHNVMVLFKPTIMMLDI